MGADKPRPVDGQIQGPFIFAHLDEQALSLQVQGFTPEQIIYVAELLRRQANHMLDYQEAKAAAKKPRLIVP
jgi:hypothetical protein